MTTTLETREGLIEIECLDCGTYRHVTGVTPDELGACQACEYLGWTFADSITESELGRLRIWHAKLRLANK
jgi:hypothetical protein